MPVYTYGCPSCGRQSEYLLPLGRRREPQPCRYCGETAQYRLAFAGLLRQVVYDSPPSRVALPEYRPSDGTPALVRVHPGMTGNVTMVGNLIEGGPAAILEGGSAVNVTLDRNWIFNDTAVIDRGSAGSIHAHGNRQKSKGDTADA